MLARLLAVVFAVIVVTAVFVAAVTFLPSIRSMLSEKGTLIVKLTDAPVELKHLNVTISSLSALRVERVFDLPYKETWENLWFAGGVGQFYVDILALQNVTRDLSITEIPPGKYHKLRITVTAANATFTNGETVDLVVPPGHVDVLIDFDINAGETTTLLVDMQADWPAISHSRRLRPVIKATVKE